MPKQSNRPLVVCAICQTPFRDYPGNRRTYCSWACYTQAPHPATIPAVDPDIRFARYVENTETCWNWTGGKTQDGYGKFTIGKRTVIAHRYAYMRAHGLDELPADVKVLHTCIDNRGCVRDDHLYSGTPQQNMDDKVAQGREYHPSGELHHNAKLTETQISEVRRRCAAGGISQRALAAEYGVTQGMISLIVLGKNWRHVP